MTLTIEPYLGLSLKKERCQTTVLGLIEAECCSLLLKEKG